MSGTVNISRGIWTDPAFRDSPFSEREAWIWMICEASWKPRSRRFCERVIALQRGQLAASVRFLAKAFDWSPARVQRYLKRLQKQGLIVVETDTGVSVITLCNYDKHQHGGKFSATDSIRTRYSADTNEKKDERRVEERRIKENKDTSLARKSYPSPDTDIAWAIDSYNAAALRQGWPQVQKVSAARRQQLKARLREAGGRAGWEHALARAEASDFICCRGTTGWSSFGFDALISSKKFARLMEGTYDNRSDHMLAINPEKSGFADGFAAVAKRHHDGKEHRN